MTKRLFSVWLVIGGLCLGLAQAQPQPVTETATSTVYISRYRLQNQPGWIYGAFDLKGNPSVRLSLPDSEGGRLQFKLYGVQSAKGPAGKPFSVTATFADGRGHIISQSTPSEYVPPKPGAKPVPSWFEGLSPVWGIAGEKAMEIQVPYGTVMINLVASGPGPAAGRLIGYIGQIRLVR